MLLLQSKESFMRDLSSSRSLSSTEEVDKAIVETREKVDNLRLVEYFLFTFLCKYFVKHGLRNNAVFFPVPYSCPVLRGKLSVDPVPSRSTQTRGQ